MLGFCNGFAFCFWCGGCKCCCDCGRVEVTAGGADGRTSIDAGLPYVLFGLRDGSERDSEDDRYAVVCSGGESEGWLCVANALGWRLMLWTVARRWSAGGSILVDVDDDPLMVKREAIALSCFLVDAGKLEIGLMVTAAESELWRDSTGTVS